MNAKAKILIRRLLALLFLTGCGVNSDIAGPPPEDSWKIELYTYKVIHTFNHDSNAFTQGLVYADSVFFEGTGGYYGKSSLREVKPETGEVIRQVNLQPNLFGEGITLMKGKIYQLTWLEKIAFVYPKDDFTQTLKTFTYNTQGWGLTSDSAQLIMSDGSSTLYFRDPETFDLIRTVTVKDKKGPVSNLNELEYIEGLIYAKYLVQRHNRNDRPGRRFGKGKNRLFRIVAVKY